MYDYSYVILCYQTFTNYTPVKDASYKSYITVCYKPSINCLDAAYKH